MKLSIEIGWTARVKGMHEWIQTHFVIRRNPRVHGRLFLVDGERRDPLHDRREARVIS